MLDVLLPAAGATAARPRLKFVDGHRLAGGRGPRPDSESRPGSVRPRDLGRAVALRVLDRQPPPLLVRQREP